MKINNPKSKRTPIVIAVVFVILLTASALTYVYAFDGNLLGWQKPQDDNSVNYDKPTEDQKSAGNQTKQNSIENENTKNGSSGSDPLPSPSPQTNGKSVVGISITASSQSSSAYQVRSLISALTTNGTCSLKLIKDSKTINKTSGVQALANSATCQGFDIPLNELEPGVWNLTLSFENDTLTGTTTSKITVQ